MRRGTRPRPAPRPDRDVPDWYKDAIIYEVHVRAFYDSDGDGIGDFRGLAEKLDYLQDLGVTALWLLPFYPSPLRDDGYDIASYRDVHPMYGTLKDVERLLREAHRRGLRVITELVMNHTSDQHPWFQRARRAKPGSAARAYYVWSDDDTRYADARIIFKDFEPSNWTWDPVAGAYYWHRFYSHQPDLNFENPAVGRALLGVLDFWAGLGVDGFRLDAVPYLFEREGTNCENLPETHAFLKKVRTHMRRAHPDRMLLAEANQWPEEAAVYFGDGDECHMAFHFPVMPRLFMAMYMEDRTPIVDILEQTPSIPAECQWAVFLRNHDELTLEMVTDEERDYMYRVYAQDQRARVNLGIRRRLAPLLGNSRRRIELMNGLLFSLPGTPVLYYGDEIGMGDNIYLGDRDAVRTPMQWSADRNAGFSRANPQQLYLPIVLDAEHHPGAVNVEVQQANPQSLLWWTKRLIGLRKRHAAFGRGRLEMLGPANHKVLAFLRVHGDEHILVVANLSRFVQYVELDLRSLAGMVPVELFGETPFPAIGELPYLLTLGPHAFYWFRLEHPAPEVAPPEGTADAGVAPVEVAGAWTAAFERPHVERVEQALRRWLPTQRWFGGKGRRVRGVTVADVVPLGGRGPAAALTLVRVAYGEGEDDVYALPLAWVAEEAAAHLPPDAIVTSAITRAGRGAVADALRVPGVPEALLDLIRRRGRVAGRQGTMTGSRTRALGALVATGPPSAARVLTAEQSNTSVVFDDRLVLKVFRRPTEGENPDVEIGRMLTERARFAHTPRLGGAITYARPRRPPMSVAVLHEFVASESDAWTHALDHLGRYFDRVVAASAGGGALPPASGTLLTAPVTAPPDVVQQTMGTYLESARLLGQRTAELHAALASVGDDPDFRPEPLGPLYQRAFYQSTRTLLRQALEACRRVRRTLPDETVALTEAVLAAEPTIDRVFQGILGRRLASRRIRQHGDLHLGQVLFTGTDFVFLDFEGEPLRALGERRLKQPPLRDVAGMLRSFHYAAHTVAAGERVQALVATPDGAAALRTWAEQWAGWASAAFVQGYAAAAQAAALLPPAEEVELLLAIYMLEKALYELRYELDNRPEWVALPLRGILALSAGAPGPT